ncbi:MAG: MBL fold metallo-hydrolase [Deltaproteobacteria bacterium]|nr:MBL fold metallo-hydrolase [Deltaproteobacteria bacterium]
MHIYSEGKITEGFYVTGSSAAHVYLLDGLHPILFDAGLSFIAHLYVRDIRGVLGDRRPSHLFLTHSHFDHVGAASTFKRIWPELRIGGSPRIGEILARPAALQRIRDLNRDSAAVLAGEYGLEPSAEDPFDPFDVELRLTGNEAIQVGPEVSVHPIHAPGHTWDFMSYWIPERRILIGSEALGDEDTAGYIQPQFVVDYDAYRRSLETLMTLDAEVLCPGHRVVVTGRPDVEKYLRQAMDTLDAYVAMLEGFLEEEDGDVERTVVRVRLAEWDPMPYPKQPEIPYLINTRARVKNILERMNRAQSNLL